jgi:hypothetical protein
MSYVLTFQFNSLAQTYGWIDFSTNITEPAASFDVYLVGNIGYPTNAGSNSIEFNTSGLLSDVYFYIFKAGEQIETIKRLII